MKIPSRLTVIAALVFALPAYAADAPGAATEAFAQSSLLGLQLATKHGKEAGKISAPLANCMAEIKVETFYPVFDTLLAGELTADERKDLDAFYQSPTGVKYTKTGMLQIYRAVGETPPETPPVFSPDELKEAQNFNDSAAGKKQKALEKSALQPVSERIKELIAQCNARK